MILSIKTKPIQNLAYVPIFFWRGRFKASTFVYAYSKSNERMPAM